MGIKELTISEFISSNRILERNIRNVIAELLEDFENLTGFTPNDIFIEMVENKQIGDTYNRHVIANVSTTFDLMNYESIKHNG